MPDGEKKPEAPKEGETKPEDPTKPPIKIVDTADQLPEGFGIIIIGGVCEHQMKDQARKANIKSRKKGRRGDECTDNTKKAAWERRWNVEHRAYGKNYA